MSVSKKSGSIQECRLVPGRTPGTAGSPLPESERPNALLLSVQRDLIWHLLQLVAARTIEKIVIKMKKCCKSSDIRSKKNSKVSKQGRKLSVQNAVQNIDITSEGTPARQLSNNGNRRKLFFTFKLSISLQK